MRAAPVRAPQGAAALAANVIGSRLLFGALAAQDRHRGVDQEPAQIAVAAPADRTELELSTGAVLPRHEAELLSGAKRACSNCVDVATAGRKVSARFLGSVEPARCSTHRRPL